MCTCMDCGRPIDWRNYIEARGGYLCLPCDAERDAQAAEWVEHPEL